MVVRLCVDSVVCLFVRLCVCGLLCVCDWLVVWLFGPFDRSVALFVGVIVRLGV